MVIKKEKEGNKLKLSLEGRLDTVTSPELEEELSNSIDGIEQLIFDMSELQYITSSGIRVLLYAQKVMNSQGKMIITNINTVVKEVFDVTGFDDIFTIEW